MDYWLPRDGRRREEGVSVSGYGISFVDDETTPKVGSSPDCITLYYGMWVIFQ